MTESTPVSVILADNHALVLEGLRSLISAEEDIHVLATASDGERLLDAVKRFNPDVVITDLQMEYLDGLGCLAQIRQLCPQTRVLILTAYTDGQTMQSVLRSGADGLLLKTDPPEQAALAVRQVMAGQMVFPAAARRWLHQPAPAQPAVALSERETEVLELLAAGNSNAQIARQLHVSVNTVKFHLQKIYQALNVSNRTEATRWYLERPSP
ncbi:MAG: response regulator transcription factor [Anaerolineales bacterium]|nr:response regulator transcription factor [Anaerolineales bacterium]